MWRSILAAPFKYWPVSSLILGSAIVLKVQLGWWIQTNGWSWDGTLVNHFGESYSGTVLDWLARLASPFAVLSVIAIFLASSVIFVLPRLVWLLIQKKRGAR